MRIVMFSLAVFLLVACNSDVYYKETSAFTNQAWEYEDVKSFKFEIKDNTAYFDLILDVNHSVDYRFENIYVKIHTSFPNGEEVEDEVSLQLADKLDQWQGKCNSNNCTTSILLQSNIYFKDAGNHKISIEQFNRDNPLEGINELTLKLISV